MDMLKFDYVLDAENFFFQVPKHGCSNLAESLSYNADAQVCFSLGRKTFLNISQSFRLPLLFFRTKWKVYRVQTSKSTNYKVKQQKFSGKAQGNITKGPKQVPARLNYTRVFFFCRGV